MKRLLKRAWRWSPVLTLPIAIGLVLWSRGTYERWQDFYVRRSSADPLDLATAGELEARHLARELVVGVGHPRKLRTITTSELRSIQLYLAEGELRRLDEHLPASGRQYVTGAMEYDGAVHEVELRYRGDSVYHWGYWKKSWRVKTKKKALFDDMRRFNLIAPRTPEQLNNYLASRLASYLGLVTPKVELCNVILNGRLMGVYVLTEQLDESTLRREMRMPGDLYSGEIIGTDTYLGARLELFDHAGAWTKVAENNHFDLDAIAPLRALLHHVQRVQEPASRAAFGQLADIDAFARFSAFEALACSVHSDSVHNWRLYYDPWRTAFEPIVWDAMGWYWTSRPRPGVALRPDVITSPLHAALFQNADFLRARIEAFQDFFTSGADAEFLAEARATVLALETSLDLDTSMVAVGEWISPTHAKAEAHRLVDDIEFLFQELRSAVGPDAHAAVRFAPGSAGEVRLEIGGRRPVEAVRVRYDRAIEAPTSALVRWTTRSGERSSDISGTLAHGEREVTLRPRLLSNHRLSITSMEPDVSRQNGLFVDPAVYTVEFGGASLVAGGAQVEAVEWRGRGDDAWTPATRAEAGLELAPIGDLEQAVPESPQAAELRWSGTMLLEGATHVAGELVIEPGTRLQMAPGAAVYLRGRLTAIGTEEAPIVVEPLSLDPAAAPWGTFALVGEGANGSELCHVHIRAGSGTIEPLAEYSAMLSIHDVQQVRLTSCLFEDSQVVDDMVHAVYSDLVFEDCDFRRSKADALDVDMGTVEVRNCRFEASGNDAIDLMTTVARVTRTRMTASGDKGISVGENSRLSALDCAFEDCKIGVQSKDDSLAVLIQCDVIDCAEGLHAYRKNWRYGAGGRIVASKCRVLGSVPAAHADGRSTIGLFDSYVDPDALAALRKEKRVIAVAVDSVSREAALSADWLPADWSLEPLVQQLWSDADGSRRGIGER